MNYLKLERWVIERIGRKSGDIDQMICKLCAHGADTGTEHAGCPGGTWCDCQCRTRGAGET